MAIHGWMINLSGFIDLTYDNRYVTVGSILLRKA